MLEESSDTGMTAQPEGVAKGDVVQDFIVSVCRLATSVNDIPALSQNGITAGEWFVLRTIKGLGRPTVTILTKRMGISRQRVSRVVRALSKAEAITLTPLAADKRNVQLGVTDKGDAILASFGESVMAAAEAITTDRALRSLTRVARISDRLNARIKASGGKRRNAGADGAIES